MEKPQLWMVTSKFTVYQSVDAPILHLKKTLQGVAQKKITEMLTMLTDSVDHESTSFFAKFAIFYILSVRILNCCSVRGVRWCKSLLNLFRSLTFDPLLNSLYNLYQTILRYVDDCSYLLSFLVGDLLYCGFYFRK